MANKSLDTVNEIVGISALEILEQRLPDGLRNAMGVMKEVSAYFKANPISATGAGNIKGDVENIQKLRTETEKLQKTNENLTKQDILNARVAKEKAIELKNLAAARLSDAKATDIQERAQQRKIDADKKETDAINKKAAAELKQAEAIKAKQAAQNIPITYQSSYAGASDSLPLADAQAALSASQAEATATAQEAAAAQATLRGQIVQTATATTSETEAFLLNLTAGQELIQEQLILKDQAAALGLQLKENAKSFKDGAISEETYTATAIQLTEELNILNAELVGINKNIKLNAQAIILDADSMAALRVQIRLLEGERDGLNILTQEGTVRQKEINAELNKYNELLRISSDNAAQQRINIGNYPTLASELKVVRQEMEKLALSGQTNSAEFKQLSARANQLTVAMGEAAAATKVASAEQAKSTNGIVSGLSKAFGGLRTLAYIIPGLGIAGIFNLAFEAIGSFIEGLKGAEDAQKKYDKALEASNAKVAEEISTLLILKSTLASTTAEREQVLDAMDKLRKIYPGHFNDLTEENRLLASVNASIDEQIKLIEQRAEVEAGQKAVSEAAAEMLKIQQDLNKETGTWEKIWASVKYRHNQVGEGYDTLSKKARDLIDIEKVLLENGVVTNAEFKARYFQIVSLSKAEGELSDAVKLTLEPEARRIELSEKKVKFLQKEIDEAKKLDESYWVDGKGSASYVKQKEKEIEVITEVIKKLKEEREARINARPPVPEKTFIEAALQEAETRAKLAKDNSKEELAEKTKTEKLKLGIAVGALKQEYADKYNLRGAELEANKQYQADYRSLVAGTIDAIEKLDSKNAKANKPKKNTELKDAMRDEDALRRAEFDAQKRLSEAIRAGRAALAEENAQTNKAIYEDETQSLEMRLEAYGEYESARQNQAKLAAVKELSDLKEQQTQIAKIEAEPASHHSNSDKILLAQKEAIAKEIENIEYTLAADLQKITTDGAKERLKILESYSEREIRLLQDRVNADKDAENKMTSDEMLELTNRLAHHQISYKKYQIEKGKIISKGNKESLDNEISAINEVLLTETLSEAAQEKLINKKYDLIQKRRDEDQKATEDAAKEDIARFEKTAEEVISIVGQISDAYFSYRKNLNQAEQDRLDNQKDEITKNSELEIDQIKAAGLTKEETEEKVAEAEARADAQSKAIDQQKRQRALEQAKFDKAQAIFNIILSTAAAVAKLLATPPLAIAAAIVGAAQLAAAAAAPLPKYAKGTSNHPGGDAIVGDGGERELIEDGGNAYWSPDTPTIVNMGKGAKVTPESDILDMANADAIRQMKGKIVTPEMYADQYIRSFENLVGKVEGGMKDVKKAIENQPTPVLNITELGMEFYAKKQGQKTIYRNKNVHF